jgi:hypothetical protein
LPMAYWKDRLPPMAVLFPDTTWSIEDRLSALAAAYLRKVGSPPPRPVCLHWHLRNTFGAYLLHHFLSARTFCHIVHGKLQLSVYRWSMPLATHRAPWACSTVCSRSTVDTPSSRLRCISCITRYEWWNLVVCPPGAAKKVGLLLDFLTSNPNPSQGCINLKNLKNGEVPFVCRVPPVTGIMWCLNCMCVCALHIGRTPGGCLTRRGGGKKSE